MYEKTVIIDDFHLKDISGAKVFILDSQERKESKYSFISNLICSKEETISAIFSDDIFYRTIENINKLRIYKKYSPLLLSRIQENSTVIFDMRCYHTSQMKKLFKEIKDKVFSSFVYVSSDFESEISFDYYILLQYDEAKIEQIYYHYDSELNQLLLCEFINLVKEIVDNNKVFILDVRNNLFFQFCSL
jgi:hypothetical protein